MAIRAGRDAHWIEAGVGIDILIAALGVKITVVVERIVVGALDVAIAREISEIVIRLQPILMIHGHREHHQRRHVLDDLNGSGRISCHRGA